MVSIINLDKERKLSEKIPFSHHVTDNIIATKQGEYIATLKLGGRASVSEDYATVERWIYEINHAIKGLCNENFAIYTYLDRRKTAEYQEKEFNNFFSAELDKFYSKKFNKDSLLINEIYISFVFSPFLGLEKNVHRKALKKMSVAERLEEQKTYIEELEKVTFAMYELFKAKKYQPVLLGKYEKDSFIYCSQVEFFHYVITREKVRIPVRQNTIADYIGNHRILFSPQGEFAEIRLNNGERHFFGMLDIKEYPENTVAGHINTLMKSNFEFMLCQSFVCIRNAVSKGFLKQQHKFLRDSDDMAMSQMDDLVHAMDDLDSGRFIMGHHYLSLQVFGKDIAQTQKNLNLAYNTLTDLHFVLTRCDLSLEGAFLGMLPTNYKYLPRPAVITSYNFLCFNSFHNEATGKPNNNPWGSAVLPLKSLSGSPIYFNFHATPLHENSLGKKALANTGVFGQSGAGKTVFLAMTLAYLNDTTKNARQVIFDKDKGMAVYVQAVDGRYYTIERNKPTGFNPLQVEDSGFIKQFIKSLLVNDGIGYNHYDDEDVSKAIKLLLLQDVEDRNLSIFVQGLNASFMAEDENSRPSVKARLAKWLRGAEYGYLFDNNHDTMELERCRVYGFDVGEFIEDDNIRDPIMTYLLYRTKSMINGEPFVYVFDEFWKMLYAEAFQNLIKDELKTIRKKNGFCYFLTQEPNDVLSHPLAPTLITQLATLVLLENGKASAEHYIDGLKLTESEFSLIKAIPESSRQMVVKNAGIAGASICSLDLGGKGSSDMMAVLSGTPDNALLVDRIKEKIAKDKVEKMLMSEVISEEERLKIKQTNLLDIHIPSSEWLPMYWQTLSDLNSVHV